jgi:two-component system chemotaxis sensor kinase CheA
VEAVQGAVEKETSGVTFIRARALNQLMEGIAKLYLACGIHPPAISQSPLAEAEEPFPETQLVAPTLDDLFREATPAAVAPPVYEVMAAPPPPEPQRAVSIQPAVEPQAAVAPAAEVAAPAIAEEAPEAARGLVEAQATVRVDTNKIDDLMNMVAELVVNRSSFMALSTNLRDILLRLLDSADLTTGDARDLRSALNRYDEATTDLGRVSNQLQEGVMRIRMMPVKTLFSRVPRLVRDLAIREGRSVKVAFTGEETELDKTVIEQLSDPLVHLIRNAISHGIETPSDRLLSGKPAEGTLKISAQHQGNMVIIEVSDDGRGIDLDAVRRMLVKKGVSSTAEVGRLSQRELLAALFLPGFSTSEKVSDVSGRGVGLDVVKRNIESLGGQIDVSSDPGKGCRFSIRIPLTMAILQALLVKVQEEIYSIPVSAIIQIVKVVPTEISTVEGQEVITVRNRVIPLVRLRDVFDCNYHLKTGQMPVETNGSATAGLPVYVVILQGEGREIGVVADSLIGGQDLVIKSLDDELVDAEGVAGAAILGDGTVTLILDVAEIQKMAIDKEHYQQKKLSDTLRVFERFVREHPVAELVHVN